MVEADRALSRLWRLCPPDWGGDPQSAAACYERLDPRSPATWRALASVLVTHWQRCGAWPAVVALSGAQGTGKSTLAAVLEAALARAPGAPRACRLSLDDFYLSRAQRRRLAAHRHPLLMTRGVPGTHELAWLEEALTALRRPRVVGLPVFDKARDDRNDRRRRLHGPFDLLILEGWLLGARPQPVAELRAPVNALEREEDADGRWRRLINAELAGGYARLNASCDWLAFLQAPDIDTVRSWRRQQEQALPPARRMGEAELMRFMAHFERLTRWMWRDVPGVAELTVSLDRRHAIARLARHR